ncbi:MAG: hypothetical protein IIC12_00725, partial [Proteobacteria bacterium]|nr:hypothetical protein [Pseudomonadota bacterium]
GEISAEQSEIKNSIKALELIKKDASGETLDEINAAVSGLRLLVEDRIILESDIRPHLGMGIDVSGIKPNLIPSYKIITTAINGDLIYNKLSQSDRESLELMLDDIFWELSSDNFKKSDFEFEVEFEDVDDDDKQLLTRAGLNVIANGPAGRARLCGTVTMSRGSEAHRKFARLPVRRLCLQIISTVAQATRWVIFEPLDATLAKKIRGQVLTYLHCLNDLGAFADDSFFVHCDAGVSQRSDRQDQGVNILLAFRPVGCEELISLTLHQTAAGCRVGSTVFGPSMGH